MSSEEEWTVVTCHDKRRVIRSASRGGALPRNLAPTSNNAPWSHDTRRAVMTTMAKCQIDLSRTNFYQSLIESIFENQTVVDQIICYGIGSLAPNPTAPMWQLACALKLREEMNDIPLHFYDPCTTPVEAKLMTEEWKIQVITENERGKRSVNGVTRVCSSCPTVLLSCTPMYCGPTGRSLTVSFCLETHYQSIKRGKWKRARFPMLYPFFCRL